MAQEKLTTILMQNFGVTKIEHYGMLFSGVVNCASSVGILSYIAGTTGLNHCRCIVSFV